MYTFLIVIAIIICCLLTIVVLIQNPKGGGLASSFSASNQIMGVKKTGDFLEKATWTLAIALLVICLGMNMFTPSPEDANPEGNSAIQEQIDNAQTQQQQPVAAPPAQTPAATDTTK